MREQNVSLGGKNVIAEDKLVVLEDSNGEICPATEAFALALFLSLHLSNGNNIKSQTEEIKNLIEDGIDCHAKECDGRNLYDYLQGSDIEKLKELAGYCDQVASGGAV